jgi:2-amino-4-ketopentanoate thiolase alpha subunit
VGRPGDWVEVRVRLLEPGARAPSVPDDTARVPYEARVHGFLEQDAELGEVVTVRTLVGRAVRGTLIEVLPPVRHSFGRPVPELLAAGVDLRERVSSEDPR